MMNLSIQDAQKISYALDYIVGYLTDISCGDPECCGGPYYNSEDHVEEVALLEKYGIAVDG